MFKNKILRVSLLSLFILASFAKSFGSVSAVLLPLSDESSMIVNADLLDSKGIIEPVIQLTNGASFQHHLQKFKKYPGTAARAFTQTGSQGRLVRFSGVNITEHPSVPIYLFNRNILI